jgi:hypothetical protein
MIETASTNRRCRSFGRKLQTTVSVPKTGASSHAGRGEEIVLKRLTTEIIATERALPSLRWPSAGRHYASRWHNLPTHAPRVGSRPQGISECVKRYWAKRRKAQVKIEGLR